MDKSSFRKLFKELYGANPKKWDNIIKATKTKFSEMPAPTKANREAITSDSFKKLIGIDFKRQADKSVKSPKSIRINNQTLAQFRNGEDTEKADVSFVNSSAVNSYAIDRNNDGTVDMTIQFVNNPKEYLYPDIPQNVAQGMAAAPSKGSYVGNVISRFADYNNPKVQAKIREGK